MTDPTLDPLVTFDSPAPTVATVAWTAPEGTHSVRYGPDLARETPPVTGADPRIDVLGMPPGATWPFVVVSVIGGVAHESAEGTLVAPLDPAPAPPFVAEILAPDAEMATRYLAITTINDAGSWMSILDPQGVPVWSIAMPPDRTAAWPRPGRDGRSWLYMKIPRDRDVDVGTIERVDLAGRPVESTFTTLAHHAYVELPSGDFGWMGLQFGTWNGAGVMADTLLEGPAGAVDTAATRQLFGFLDDWQPLFVPCWHFNMLESHFGVDDVHEWTHANSLAWDEPSDTYYLGARLHDAVLAIDGETGAVKWQMGGGRSDFTFADPADAWSHDHFSDMWPGGLLAFDNALHGSQPASRIVEYAWDEDLRTVEQVWSYEEPNGAIADYLGDARRLPGGDILAVWNTLGRIEELTPEGEVVWRLTTDPELALGRVWVLSSLDAPGGTR